MEKSKAETEQAKQDKFEKVFTSFFYGTIIAMIVFAAGFLIGDSCAEKKLYPVSGVVIDKDKESDTVTIEIGTGFRYQLYGYGDWEIGDRCSMIMNPMGTKLIYDDQILKAYYEGSE